MKKINRLKKEKEKKKFSSIKSKVAIKFPKENFFFLPKIGLALKELIIILMNTGYIQISLADEKKDLISYSKCFPMYPNIVLTID